MCLDTTQRLLSCGTTAIWNHKDLKGMCDHWRTELLPSMDVHSMSVSKYVRMKFG